MAQTPDRKISLKPADDQAAGAGESLAGFKGAQMEVTAQPWRLMADLRSIMADAGHTQDKLDRIVILIAKALEVDVCSCFLIRAGDILELFATVGLKKDAVHKTRLAVGEGIIGEIAAHAIPVAVTDAKSHPHFIYKPETGEEAYTSLCGVPILRGRRVRGVLAVQTKQPRRFGENAIEILQTVAMVLAELAMSGDLISRGELLAGFASGQKPTQIKGTTFSEGLAVGHAVIYDPAANIREIVAGDPRAEKLRLKRALVALDEQIVQMMRRSSGLWGRETKDILEAYQMFAKDKGWVFRLETAINQGLSAEAAVRRVQGETRARMATIGDVYIKERIHDLEDISNRLLAQLTANGHSSVRDIADLPDDIILVANTIGPGALFDFDRSRLKGVLLEDGGSASHVAIVARSLGIPVVGQCGDILSYLASGDQVIVDGNHGIAYIRPSAYVIDAYGRSMERQEQQSIRLSQGLDEPTVTRDGKKISLQINAGLLAEMDGLKATGADGVGLFRTELSFMGWPRYPRVVLQAEFYGKVLDQAAGKPVTFRTLDIGGDKPLPYFDAPKEDNPALGWRAIRIGLDRPAVLKTQFRAFIMGAKGRALRIMLPFVAEVDEVERARGLLQMELDRAERRGVQLPCDIKLGVMIEVPALLFQLDRLLECVDFVSIGTNDLMQYLFAVDRSSNVSRNRYDPLSPPMLNALSVLAKKCREKGVPAAICGEMAGKPLEVMALASLGFDIFSMPPQAIGPVKDMVRSLDTNQVEPYLLQLMGSKAHSIRRDLLAFARDRNIVID